MQKKKANFTRYIDKHTGKCFRNLKDAELGGDQVHQRAGQGHVGRHGLVFHQRQIFKDNLSEN